MLPGLDSDAFHQFALRRYGDEYFIDKFRSSYSRKIFYFSEYTLIADMIAVEKCLEPIPKMLVLLKLLRQRLTNSSGADNDHVASPNPLLDSAYHNLSFHVPPNDHCYDVEYQTAQYNLAGNNFHAGQINEGGQQQCGQ